jgi:hypothetical protein
MSKGNSSYLRGLIDNVFCYPRVLTSIEINTLYNSQLANPLIENIILIYNGTHKT